MVRRFAPSANCFTGQYSFSSEGCLSTLFDRQSIFLCRAMGCVCRSARFVQARTVRPVVPGAAMHQTFPRHLHLLHLADAGIQCGDLSFGKVFSAGACPPIPGPCARPSPARRPAGSARRPGSGRASAPGAGASVARFTFASVTPGPPSTPVRHALRRMRRSCR